MGIPLRTVLLPKSATHRLPAVSTATPYGFLTALSGSRHLKPLALPEVADNQRRFDHGQAKTGRIDAQTACRKNRYPAELDTAL